LIDKPQKPGFAEVTKTRFLQETGFFLPRV